MSRTTVRLAWIAALAIVAASAWVAYTRSRPAVSTSSAATAAAATPVATEEGRAQFIRWFVAQPRLDINLSAEGAKVMILKFNDFQCPPCAQSHTEYMPIIKKVLSEHPGAVRYQMVDYPLESECNKYVAIGPHAAACEAAAAVRLAWAHNRQDAMMDWLFANQAQLTPAIVRQAAREIGRIPDFDARYAATLESIKGDIELGHFIGIRETPTFVVNGVVLEGRFAPDYIEAAIDHELQAPATPAK
jgi:protein-disulfide isomerase